MTFKTLSQMTGQPAQVPLPDVTQKAAELSERQGEILDLMRDGVARTDREIANSLLYTDMNAVRPRITELVKLGLMSEIGVRRCPVSGRRVRLTAWRQ